MAISAGAAGAWAAVNATTQTVTLPTHSAGQMLLLVAACKAATITSVDPTITTPATGWTRLASFADGTTNTGNGTGSVRQAIFYKIAASGSETNPVVTWGGSQTSTPGIALAQSFSLGGGEVWLTPVVLQGAIPTFTNFTVTMGSNPGITAGDWGVVFHTTRDDSALTVPSWSATGTTLAAVVEYPATAIASGTSDDMAGDACYRSVTSGTASAAPVTAGTQTVGETGVSGFVRLRVEAANPQTATPTTASVTTTTFAPTITIPNNQLVTPSTLATTTSTFAPTVTASDHKTVTPSTASLTTATFAPVLKLVVTPTTPTVALATFAPTVAVSDHQTVTPTTASLVLTTFAPTVSATAHQVVTPTTADLAATAFAPTATLTDNQLVTPDLAALTLATFAATVTASDHKTVTPDVTALALTTFAPTVDAFQGTTVQPDSADLTLATFAPVVALSDNQLVTAGATSMSLASFAPVVTALAPQLATPSTAALALALFAPTVRVTGPITSIDSDLDSGPSFDGELDAGPGISGSVGAVRIRARLVVSPPPASGSIDVD